VTRKTLLALILVLAACKDETAAVPQPVEMTDEALGHYCQMYLSDHAGPKAQIHLDGYDQPLWFSQVSDAVAYVHDPEQIAPIAAIYVSDMAKAASWAEPGKANWIAATDARYVIESAQLGGMGVPEAIPFGTEAAADAFVAAHGGKVVTFDAVPEAYVRPQMMDMETMGESQ
jgi:copper chaperone NosL